MIEKKDLVLLFLILIISACNKNHHLNDEDFPILIINKNKNEVDSALAEYIKRNSLITYKMAPFTNPLIYRYSQDNKFKIFKNVDYELFLSFFYLMNSEPKFKQFDCLIGIKEIYDIYTYKPIALRDKAFIIFWSNKLCDSLNLNTLIRESMYSYTHQIDETTDSLYTTLSKKIILEKFPKFKGHYKKIKVDSIIIDYGYCISEIEFFDAIKIFGFNKKRIIYYPKW